MRYPKYVRSELKGGVNVTLGPRTVLVGKNGSGKSAVVQSIELTSLGCVTDMEGRPSVSKPGTLARLFPGSKRSVQVEWSDGSLFSWELLEGKKGSFKDPEVSRPFQPRFLISELMDLFGKEDAAVRSWLETRVYGAVTIDDVLNAVGRAHEAELRVLARLANRTDFLGLAEEARSQTRSLRTRATQDEKTIERLTQGLAAPLTDGERKTIEDRLAALSKGGISQEEFDRAQQEAERLRAELAVPVPEQARHRALLVELQQDLERHLSHFGAKECFLCGTSSVDLERRLTEIRGLVNTLPGGDVLRARAAASTRLAVLEETLQKPVDHNERARRDLQEVLYGDTEARKAWANAQAERAKIMANRATAAVYEQLAQQLDDYGRLFLKARKSKFEQLVSPFLGDEFALDLDASRVGLKRGDYVHTALSGVEEARVLMALGASLQAEDAIMIPKDRAWDPDTLAKTMAALTESPTPVMIMSTVKPSRVVEGWTLVELT